MTIKNSPSWARRVDVYHIDLIVPFISKASLDLEHKHYIAAGYGVAVKISGARLALSLKDSHVSRVESQEASSQLM